MTWPIRLLRRLFLLSFAGFFFGVVAMFGLYLYLAPQLPPVETLREVQLQVPLRVYSHEGLLISEFGEQRRSPITIEQVPPQMVQAFLAAEDDRFYEHPGVDYQGLLRAAVELIRTGRKSQGGSTITMQVARNFFLSREKTFLRKINEIFLSLKIERDLSKQEILALYLNKIYLGNRAYGVAAAAQVYYGTDIGALNLSQIAMIAGLPKAPSRYNPIANPSRALERRNYVLGRMLKLGMIGQAQYDEATSEPVSARLFALEPEVEAPYVAEMVRAEMVERYGDAAYTDGYKVTTSIRAEPQEAANTALRDALVAYEQRHGYRGPEARIELGENSDSEAWDAALKDYSPVGDLSAALVLEVGDKSARIYLGDSVTAELSWKDIEWARKRLDNDKLGPKPNEPADVLAEGDVVRVRQTQPDHWELAQVPEVSGALVSVLPDDGAIIALVGGFDFYQSKFNRVIQARRQPGSGFKPFIYSAALDAGFTPATLVNDAPVVFDDPALEAAWRPENYSGKTFGETRLRVALANSRNLVSIRVLRQVGIQRTIDYVKRFGFEPERLPKDLSLSLGSAAMTPLEMASAYAVLANGGFKVEPYFIESIENGSGELIEKINPLTVCRDCEDPGSESPPADSDGGPETPRHAPRVMDTQNNYLMFSMLQDVIRVGTARKARKLGRKDLAGKTGTTNEQRDAWFNGFNSGLVTTAWVGFDDSHPLGRGETGGAAALPMWMDYMGKTLRDQPEQKPEQPPGLVSVRIDPVSGLLASASQRDAVFEIFREGNVPARAANRTPDRNPSGESTAGPAKDPYTPSVSEQLF